MTNDGPQTKKRKFMEDNEKDAENNPCPAPLTYIHTLDIKSKSEDPTTSTVNNDLLKSIQEKISPNLEKIVKENLKVSMIDTPYQINHHLNYPISCNVHGINLDACEKTWLNGAWFVLLPNVIAHFINNKESLVLKKMKQNFYNTIEAMNPISFDHLSWGTLNEYVKRTINISLEQHVEILNSLKNLFVPFIMCKIASEKLDGQDLTLLFDGLQGFISTEVLNATFETYQKYLMGNIQQPIQRASYVRNIDFLERCQILKQTLEDNWKNKLSTWLQENKLTETPFGKTIENLTDAIAKENIELYEETLSLIPGEKSCLNEIKERIAECQSKKIKIKN